MASMWKSLPVAGDHGNTPVTLDEELQQKTKTLKSYMWFKEPGQATYVKRWCEVVGCFIFVVKSEKDPIRHPLHVIDCEGCAVTAVNTKLAANVATTEASGGSSAAAAAETTPKKEREYLLVIMHPDRPHIFLAASSNSELQTWIKGIGAAIEGPPSQRALVMEYRGQPVFDVEDASEITKATQVVKEFVAVRYQRAHAALAELNVNTKKSMKQVLTLQKKKKMVAREIANNKEALVEEERQLQALQQQLAASTAQQRQADEELNAFVSAAEMIHAHLQASRPDAAILTLAPLSSILTPVQQRQLPSSSSVSSFSPATSTSSSYLHSAIASSSLGDTAIASSQNLATNTNTLNNSSSSGSSSTSSSSSCNSRLQLPVSSDHGGRRSRVGLLDDLLLADEDESEQGGGSVSSSTNMTVAENAADGKRTGGSAAHTTSATNMELSQASLARLEGVDQQLTNWLPCSADSVELHALLLTLFRTNIELRKTCNSYAEHITQLTADKLVRFEESFAQDKQLSSSHAKHVGQGGAGFSK